MKRTVFDTRDATVLVDFGSTFTKVRIIDQNGHILSTTSSPSTVRTDAKIGLDKALKSAEEQMGIRLPEQVDYVASSSAAGGLRMVCSGYVPELTSKAATEAALGAGSKLIACYSYKLNVSEIKNIREISPDIILLVGGTNGGNSDIIVHNARMIAAVESIASQIIVAGNEETREVIASTFKRCKKSVTFTRNVMPEFGILDIEACKEEIRKLFMKRIARTKGLEHEVLMPTPLAVLKAAHLLSEGTEEEKGMGDLMVVDVGGATTDVVSIGEGKPRLPRVVLRGLPEPYVKRTVEGDLGVRHNIDVLAEIGRRNGMFSSDKSTRMLDQFSGTELIPRDDDEMKLDTELALIAVQTAVDRHAGRTEIVYNLSGSMHIQHGKDLTNVGCIIGTGGPIVFSKNQRRILEAAVFDPSRSDHLKPKSPHFYVDEQYILYAAGLMSETNQKAAFTLMKKNLKEV
jgi:uncharacterized protein (TIGR01319 family)